MTDEAKGAPETIWVTNNGRDYFWSMKGRARESFVSVPYIRKDISDKRIAEARNEALEEAAKCFRETRVAIHTRACLREEIPCAQINIQADLDAQEFLRTLKADTP